MKRFFAFFALSLLCLGIWTGTSFARSVYLSDGSVIENVLSVTESGGKVHVLVNRDVQLTLQPEEVDRKKTFAGQRRQVKPVHKPKVQKAAAVSPVDPAVEAKAEKPAVTAAAPAGPATPAPQQAPLENKPAPPEAQQPPQEASQPVPVQMSPEEQRAAAMAMMGPQLWVFVAVFIASTVLFIAIFWKVYAKAGEAGWKCLIPIYNMVVLLRMAGKPLWWVLLFFVPILNLIFMTLAHIALAKRFGKEAWFGFGLTFVPFIFFGIIAFDSSTYTYE